MFNLSRLRPNKEGTMNFQRIAISAVIAGLVCGAAAAPAGAVTAEISGSTLLVRGGRIRADRGRPSHGLRWAQSYTVSAFAASSDVVRTRHRPGLRPSVFGVNNDDSGMALCAPTPVQAVVVEGLGGNDELQVDTSRPWRRAPTGSWCQCGWRAEAVRTSSARIPVPRSPTVAPVATRLIAAVARERRR